MHIDVSRVKCPEIAYLTQKLSANVVIFICKHKTENHIISENGDVLSVCACAKLCPIVKLPSCDSTGQIDKIKPPDSDVSSNEFF